MQEGFVTDAGESGHPVSRWIEGNPQVPWTRFGVKINERTQHPVRTYRCAKCGYLESYARVG